MYEHFKNIEFLYGEDVSIQIPNGIFKKLSSNIKNRNGSTNIQQTSFAYAYIVMNAFLYKYAHFVDVDNGTYIQNADIKGLLGYNKVTKTIDYIIKKGGVLDMIGLTETINNYPIRFFNHPTERINNIPLREYVTIKDIDNTDSHYDIIKGIVKNHNYAVKEPTFLFEYDDDNGTLYEFSNTHKITLNEFMKFIFNDSLDNIDFMMYCFFKSKCKGLKHDMNAIGLNYIVNELGIGKDAFYGHLEVLKKNRFLEVNHKGWVMGSSSELESNEYYFIGVR